MSGGETVRMREGELWWFDNKQFHESQNQSDDSRIFYIFGLLPAEYRGVAVNAVLLPPDPSGHTHPDWPAQLADQSASVAAPAPAVRDLLLTAIDGRPILRAGAHRLVSPNRNSNDWLRIPAMPIANSNLMAIRIPIDADHHRSKATLDRTYHP
jgi:hypothetical protein